MPSKQAALNSGLAIDVAGLVVRYGDVEAVKGIDMQIQSGEILAFLGPNGAGKTSTLEVLEGFIKPAAGRVSVLGVDPQHADRTWRDRVGIVLQESTPDGDLTAVEFLKLFASYYSNPRSVDELMELVGLTKVQKTRAAKLSGGEKRRLDVAMALVGNPELVFLDEPTTGFDPNARHTAWEMIRDLRNLGVTVLLTTHYMDEAEHLADRIAIIAEGRIVGGGTSREIVKQAELQTMISWDANLTADNPVLDNQALGSPVTVHTPDGDRMQILTDNIAEVLRELLALPNSEAIANSLVVEPPDLEQSYLTLVERASTAAVPA